jgi:DNA mismatch endonuclease (patch repair protein)
MAPATNAAYWSDKVAGNAQRDRETDRRLRDAGWMVLRFWEHADPMAIADEVERLVRERVSALA